LTVNVVVSTSTFPIQETATLYGPALIVAPSPGLGQCSVGALASDEYTLYQLVVEAV
jgi:hypothetical protein